MALAINFEEIPSPSFVIDLPKLEDNARILSEIQRESGCHVLLALKGFACSDTFPMLKKYLSGTAASGLHEAILGSTRFGGEVHVCGPAYPDSQIEGLLEHATAITFNSFSQWQRFKGRVLAHSRKISCGIRVNPETSVAETEIYNPCAPGSRLGSKLSAFKGQDLAGIEGLHVHALCQQNVDALQAVWEAVESRFGHLLPQMKWLNLGGGHHITRSDYDRATLIKLLKSIKEKYNLQVILEPGEAVGLNAGYLMTSVEDILEDSPAIAVLDTSATTHMPDVLEMPYRPEIIGAGLANEKRFTYLLGGMSCLAGDRIGAYSFEQPLQIGQRLVFTDMAIYSMVKTTTFNGVPLPSITTWDGKSTKFVKQFGYEDFADRLG